jgi:hypothetical protein
MVPVLAAQTPTAPSSPAGKWTVVWANTPDKSQPMELTIDAKKSVTGIFNGSAIVGEFANGSLTFASPQAWQERQTQVLGTSDQKEQNAFVSFATVSADGTLAGYTDHYLREYGPVGIKRWTWKASRTTGR